MFDISSNWLRFCWPSGIGVDGKPLAQRMILLMLPMSRYVSEWGIQKNLSIDARYFLCKTYAEPRKIRSRNHWTFKDGDESESEATPSEAQSTIHDVEEELLQNVREEVVEATVVPVEVHRTPRTEKTLTPRREVKMFLKVNSLSCLVWLIAYSLKC